MNGLYRKFQSLMIKNLASRYYIPDSRLTKVMTEVDGELEEWLRSSGIDTYSRPDVLRAIREGGHKVFTILVLAQGHPVHLMLNFLRHDQYIPRWLDSKLPFDIDELNLILKDGDTAEEFYKQQWGVIAPLFQADRTHRVLKHDTIIPFTNSKPIKPGGFGDVFEVTLPADHHGFVVAIKATSEVKIACKQIMIGDYENEKRILQLIRLLRHENMVQLLASYSVQSPDIQLSHYLLMPLADISLKDILERDDKGSLGFSSYFATDEDLFQQIHALSSAIEVFHFYENSNDDLRLKGCHFDLDPRNILIHDGKLLLADFGLSRLRNETSNSCTPFQGCGASHFTAPECLEGDSLHGRASDVWSFGCILAVMIAFMISGSSSVTEFCTARKHTADGKTTYRFHADSQHNPGVEKWMGKYEAELSDIQRNIWDTTRQMMKIDPLQRPNSKEVTAQLFMTAQKAQFRSIFGDLSRLCERTNSLKLHLERERFVIWGAGAGLTPMNPTAWLAESKLQHIEVKRLLQSMRAELRILTGHSHLDHPVRPFFAPLQDLCESLWNLTPDELRWRMFADLDSAVMKFADLPKMKVPSDEDLDENYVPSYERRLTKLLAIKQLTSLAQTGLDVAGSVRHFNENEITVKKSIYNRRKKVRERSYVSLKDSAHQYLCEWVYCDVHTLDQAPERLHRRVQSIARQFSTKDRPSELRALRCEGYFLKRSAPAFGLLFRYPNVESDHVDPWELNFLMHKSYRPSLTTIFQIAQAMVQSLWCFHNVGWLHKNISSHSIIFFDDRLPAIEKYSSAIASTLQSRSRISGETAPEKKAKSRWWSPARSHTGSALTTDSRTPEASNNTKSSDDTGTDEKLPAFDSLPLPYVVGFNHSRPNDPTTFTQGGSGLWYDYQHHQYADEPGQRFQLGYDYYSIGLVLLEIGLWEPLSASKLLDRDIGDTPLSEQQRLWVEKAVPLLGPKVGNVYRDAVEICLSGQLLELDESDAKRMFSTKVVQALSRCQV